MINPIKPNFKVKTEKETVDFGRFVIEPLDQGYGLTVGNALRRCLMTSLPGAAITQVKIDGVRHQFSTISGLKEDVVEFILNLKKIKIDYKEDKEIKAVLEAKGPGEVKAGDIKLALPAKIVNKDLVLATLADKKAKINCQLWINTGYGYSPAEDRKSNTIGMIPVDAAFTPVIRVNYKVEATRVGHRTDYDKLIMEIWTDGSLKPKAALESSAKTLQSFFKQIYQPVIEEEVEVETKEIFNEFFNLTVEELNLPTRIANALRRGGFGTIKELVTAKKGEIAKVKNLGKKSIEIIKEKLAKKGVSLSEA